jgi:pyruvate formate lyase activating enzyme
MTDYSGNDQIAGGVVFDIQRYSIHDGPGIRTMIFLKGCPLNCKWCSNPESSRPEPQLFYQISKCVLCRKCVQKAKNSGIQLSPNGNLEIDYSIMNKQDLSWIAEVCPTGALSVKGAMMTAEDVFNIVMKDEIYFRQSNGGITLSGGEPLMQAGFAEALLVKAHRNMISTAIETSGYIQTKTLLSIAPYTDLFLYDFKLIDDDLHRIYTGVSNEIIKDNLKTLANKGAEILVRMPIIPSVNDNDDIIERTLDFLKSIGVYRFTVLPYHQLGIGKYSSIGSTYTLNNILPPGSDTIESIMAKITGAGFRSD